MPIRRFFSFSRAATPGQSASSYVPIVILSRGLAFLRVLAVAKILGNAGEEEFGLYQPALELINWLVPLVMFGLADVAERYAARFEKENRLGDVLQRHLFRLVIVGLTAILGLVAASPWLIGPIFHLPNADHSRTYAILLVGACAVTILLLALDIYLASVLRGLGAYFAAAGMEFMASTLLLAFSLVAAWRGGSLGLISAYALSLLVPIIYYGFLLLRHCNAGVSPASEAGEMPALHANRFAAWSLVRLLLVMSFGFLSIWSIGHLAPSDAQTQTAAYSMPYRIAQLLAYIAITLWASCYGIAARHCSHHQTRRAKVQLFRVGKFGAVLLTLIAVILLLARGIFAAILPSAYAQSINVLLPALLAIFIWYGLLAFAGTFADLQEAPYKSAALWGLAVAAQLVLILGPWRLDPDPKQHVLLASAAGLALSLFLLAPVLLWHPFRMTATSVPLVLLALAPSTLFAPPWVVNYIAPPVMLAAIAFLYLAGLLVRPLDRRSYRLRVRHGRGGDATM